MVTDPALVIPASSSPRTATRLRILTVVAALAITVVVAMNRSSLFAVLLLFTIIVPFEKLFPRHRQKVRRPALGTDLAYALAATPLNVIGLVVGVVIGVLSFAWVPGLLLRPFVGALPAVPRALAGVVLFDFTVYWAHRLGHEVPFLWRFHQIHHSTRQLDWVSGFRGHPLDGVLLAPAFVLLLAAGFTPQLGGALVVVQVVTGLFLHANVRWRWRPLQKLVITPEFHHWHHANETAADNTNYAALLPLWDLVFGTYRVPAQQRPRVYGVDHEVPDGILAQLWLPLRGLPNPLRACRHPTAAARAGFSALRRGVEQIVTVARGRPVTAR